MSQFYSPHPSKKKNRAELLQGIISTIASLGLAATTVFGILAYLDANPDAWLSSMANSPEQDISLQFDNDNAHIATRVGNPDTRAEYNMQNANDSVSASSPYYAATEDNPIASELLNTDTSIVTTTTTSIDPSTSETTNSTSTDSNSTTIVSTTEQENNDENISTTNSNSGGAHASISNEDDPVRQAYLRNNDIQYFSLIDNPLEQEAYRAAVDVSYEGIHSTIDDYATWTSGYNLKDSYNNPNILTANVDRAVYDHPILSAYRTGNDNVAVYVNSDGSFMIGSSVATGTENVKDLYQQIDERASQIANTAHNESNGNIDDFIKNVYLQICYNCTYSDDIDDSTHANDIYGALCEGESKCYGLSCAFKYILDKENIPSLIAYGDGNGIPHAWNVILLEDKWVVCDLTAGSKLIETVNKNLDLISERSLYQVCAIPQQEYFAKCHVTMDPQCLALENSIIDPVISGNSEPYTEIESGMPAINIQNPTIE